MNDLQKKVKIWKDLIAHFRQNRTNYSHGECEEIERLSKYISECAYDTNENAATIRSIREKVFKWKLTWKDDVENFNAFFRLCNEIVKDEEIFNAIQAELTNIKPIDDATIEQFYREITGAFDAEKFVLCRRILKSIQQKNQPLVWQDYYDAEGDLIATVKNRPTAKKILVRFCVEINLECKPCTLEELEEWKKQKASYNIQLKDTIDELKEFFDEKGGELDEFKIEIDKILSTIKDSNEYKEKYIDKLTNSTKSFYQDEEKINQLRRNKDELQKVKQKIEKLRKSVLDLKKHIADKIKEVETAVGGEKLSNITDSNVIAMLGRVTKAYEAVIQKYDKENNANIDEYNTDIKRFNTLVEQFDKLTDEIEKERKKTDEYIVEKIKTLKYDYLKLRINPVAKIFVLLQAALLFGSVILEIKWAVKSVPALFFVSILLLLWYIHSEIRRFNKMNETVYELQSYIVNSFTYRKKNTEGQTETVTVKVKYFTRLKLIGHIILSCIVFLFVSLLILITSSL